MISSVSGVGLRVVSSISTVTDCADGDAFAFREHHLVEGHGGAAELGDAEPHFDAAGPAQLGAEMDVEAHHASRKAPAASDRSCGPSSA